MNIEQSTTVKNLNDSLTLIRGVAVIADDALIEEIEGVLDRLSRVNTNNSNAIIRMARPAFEVAKEIFGKAERAAELKALATWLTNIQLSWL